jgi:hypothetical protein
MQVKTCIIAGMDHRGGATRIEKAGLLSVGGSGNLGVVRR